MFTRMLKASVDDERVTARAARLRDEKASGRSSERRCHAMLMLPLILLR